MRSAQHFYFRELTIFSTDTLIENGDSSIIIPQPLNVYILRMLYEPAP